MATAYLDSAYRGRPSLSSRLSAVAIALAAVLALIAALIGIGALPIVPMADGPALATFDVAAPGERAAPRPRPRSEAPAPPAPRRATPRTPPPPPAPPVPTTWPKEIMLLSREEFTSAEIGRLPRDPAGAVETASAGAAPGDSPFEPGAGPGGERLYGAEWVREPTRAELAFYLPKRAQEGWGLIVCKTAPRNRVEDCRVLGESPGSGIARGLREAAWQFLVRPPRVGGKPMIGAWVRIKFDLVRGVAG